MSKKKSQNLKLGYQTPDGVKIIPKMLMTDIELLPGHIYNIGITKNNNGTPAEYFIKETEPFELPKELVWTTDMKKCLDHIIHSFDTLDMENIGILLHGQKGAGKSVVAKYLLLNAKIPIIWANPDISYENFSKLLSSYPGRVGILFEEFEKFFRKDDSLLTFLDGGEYHINKIPIFVCNEVVNLDQNAFANRPSRVLYVIRFDKETNLFVRELIKEFGIEDKYDKLYTFITTTFKYLSMDIVKTFLTLMKAHNISAESTQDMLDLIKFTSIETKHVNNFKPVQVEEGLSLATTLGDIYKVVDENTDGKLTSETFLDALSEQIDGIMTGKKSKSFKALNQKLKKSKIDEIVNSQLESFAPRVEENDDDDDY